MAGPTVRRLLIFSGLGVAAAVVACAGLVGPCWSAWALEGLWVQRCPAGSVRWVPSVSAWGLGRGRVGTVEVQVDGAYVIGGEAEPRWAPVGRFDVDLVVVDGAGREVPLEPEDGWAWSGERKRAEVKLPDGPDGDWTLKVTTRGGSHAETVALPLPVYAPALAHVLTDAPLYRAGQVVRFRSVLLDERSLAPLEGRPGRWVVTDPEGEVLLEEKARTGAWGVAESSFPLDRAAASGPWTVRFESGPAVDERPVAVRPFELPRFLVDAASERRWWRAGEVPVVTGTVRYASGAPVGDAVVSVTPRASGEWPVPAAWTEPRTVTTSAEGRFRLQWDAVPEDLRRTGRLDLSLIATDAAGDTATGSASLLFSADAVAADVVTELADGVVPAANNRLYLRLTRPDGEVLRGATLRLRRAWDADDPGVEAVTDGDGVARLQVDPGEPITVVEPAMPVRAAPVEAARVELAGSRVALGASGSLDLAARGAVDRWTEALAACLPAAPPRAEAVEVRATVVVRADGRVALARAEEAGASTALSACVERSLAGQRAPAGGDRVWELRWGFTDRYRPYVAAEVEARRGDPGVARRVEAALRETRRCVDGLAAGAALPDAWFWTVEPGERTIRLTRLAVDPTVGVLDGARAACVTRGLAGLALDAPAGERAEGLLRLRAEVPENPAQAPPQPTTWPGFEFDVVATMGGEPVGGTTLRLRPGAIPPLRVRLSEVLVDPGATVEVSLLRGPDWSGDPPAKVYLKEGEETVADCEPGETSRSCRLTVPTTVRGFLTVDAGAARAVLYVRGDDQLQVGIRPDRPTYRPGETARLTVTTAGRTGVVPAAVSLVGVDRTMAQLEPLPGPDDQARVLVRATSDQPAFGVLDARALQTGLVRGENAAQAAVLRVSGLSPRPPGHEDISATASGRFAPDEELADTFYAVYVRARERVRAWAADAPAGQVLTPPRMAELWGEAVGEARDPWGRPLRLSVLPPDLLALVDPREMVDDAARLPEDIEDWATWVAKEAP